MDQQGSELPTSAQKPSHDVEIAGRAKRGAVACNERDMRKKAHGDLVWGPPSPETLTQTGHLLLNTDDLWH